MDYTITYVPGTLTITPASLTITADDQSSVYGATLPALAASYAGFVNGDTPASLAALPTLTTLATAASGVGSYTITAIGAADADYTINYVPGTLTITPAALTITADDQSSIYGSTLPALTASYVGFVNGDTPASLGALPTLTTLATAASGVGSCTIAASGAADADYTINYVPGTLTIAPTPLTITANDQDLDASNFLVAPEPLIPSPGTVAVPTPTTASNSVVDAVVGGNVGATVPSAVVVVAAVSDSPEGRTASSTITAGTVASAAIEELPTPAPAITPSSEAVAQGTVAPPIAPLNTENLGAAHSSSPTMVPIPAASSPGSVMSSLSFHLPPSTFPIPSTSGPVPLQIVRSIRAGAANIKSIEIVAHLEQVGRPRFIALPIMLATNARGSTTGFNATAAGNFQPVHSTIADLALLELGQTMEKTITSAQDTADLGSSIGPTRAVDEQFSRWGIATPPLPAAVPEALDRIDLSTVAEQVLESITGSDDLEAWLRSHRP